MTVTLLQRYTDNEAEKNDRHFVVGLFKRVFLNENVRFSIEISLKIVPKDPFADIHVLA